MFIVIVTHCHIICSARVALKSAHTKIYLIWSYSSPQGNLPDYKSTLFAYQLITQFSPGSYFPPQENDRRAEDNNGYGSKFTQ